MSDQPRICPKCHASEETSCHFGDRAGCYGFRCGSWFGHDGIFHQTDDCRISVLTADNAELLYTMKRAAEGKPGWYERALEVIAREHPGEAVSKELAKTRDEVRWYQDRCQKIQRLQGEGMPDPWRRIVCNVLANGMFMPDDSKTARQALEYYAEKGQSGQS